MIKEWIRRILGVTGIDCHFRRFTDFQLSPMQVGQLISPSYGFPVICISKSAHLTGFVQIIHVQD